MGAGRPRIMAMNIPGSDDWVEQALRRSASEHARAYVDDNGFTSTVLARLPAPAALPSWRRPFVVFLWIVATAGIAAALPGLATDVFGAIVGVVTTHPPNWTALVALAVGLIAASWSALVYAARSD